MSKTKRKSKSPPGEKKTKRKKLRVVDKYIERVIEPAKEIIQNLAERHPLDVDVNTKNPLLESILHPSKLPKKMKKNVILGCTKEYGLTEADMPRFAELKKLHLPELRDIISNFKGERIGKTHHIEASKKEEFIRLIICVENEIRKQREIEELEAKRIQEQEQATLLPQQEQEEEEEEEEKQEQEALIENPLQEPTTELEIGEPSKDLAAEIPQLDELKIPQDEIPVLEDNQLPSIDVELSENEQKYQNELDVLPDTNSDEYNQYLFNREKMEYETNKTYGDEYDFLYPELDDPDFSLKIAKRKEFNDTKFDGEIRDIKKHSNLLCNSEFELMPHQLFVKNFLSSQTPYNALLLYHSLGTGKTCSSIGIAEEMRTYMKQVGINQRILIVASPNVQQNFRLQLFDERKLENNDGIWSLDTCVGNSILKEINPTNLKGLNRETVVKQINALINQSYVFIGYFELANYITRKILLDNESIHSEKDRKNLKIKRIRSVFDNRLIIIDEVHNIRMTDDNKKNKKTAALLMEVVKYANNIRLLLLSATPMYNSHKEIIMLTNLLNLVDKRSSIKEEDVFDKTGAFLPERTGPDGGKLEDGRELLKRKLTGYVSYVRGENPYTFPFRVYPDTFSPEHLVDNKNYPSLQMNKRPIEAPIQHLPIFISEMGEYQQRGYDFIINYLQNKSFNTTDLYGRERDMPNFENMESFGYTLLKQPLESLNIVFPNDGIDNANAENAEETIKSMLGKEGLSNIMTFKTVKSTYMLRHEFEYKPDVLEKYGRIFSPAEISKYSNKISNICQTIKNSTGIIIVYSQYIDGGIVPLALSLEEMGFSRYGAAQHTKSLFKTSPSEAIDSITMKPRSEFTGDGFKPAKYVIISGDPSFSPNNLEDIKQVTNPDNKNGEKIKVILITKAAAEGVDFKNVRQVHILEPWYNLNRTEQIIGRGVRNLSHCQLPFEERNVEIYLHASKRVSENVGQMGGEGENPNEGAVKEPEQNQNVSAENAIDENVEQPQEQIEVSDQTVDEVPSENTEQSLEEAPIVESEETVEEAPIVESEQIVEEEPSVESEETVEEAPIVESEETVEEAPIVESEQTVEDAPIVESEQTVEESTSEHPSQEEESGVESKQTIEEEPSVESEQTGQEVPSVESEQTGEESTSKEPSQQELPSAESEQSVEETSIEEPTTDITTGEIINETTNNNREEPADLYVYRYAEKKAIQIGKITRLLKEVAVDCLLNISQTNFTVDKLNELTQNQKVIINLSSKKDVEFKIGDKPFTDVCDYMDNCSFTCSSSTSTINEGDIIKTTYNEDFIRMNYPMIAKRLRQLFREQGFYKRDDLIKLINIVKVYPTEQIDFVLTRFVDNKNDYILDKYGRRGYLTNRDDFYAFQPIEITDENASIFERSVPLEYKPTSIELELPKKIEKEELVKDYGEAFVETENSDISVLEANIIEKYNEIIELMKVNMRYALVEQNVIIESGEVDWYKHVNNVFDKLHKYHGIPEELITKYIVYHNLDTLSFQEKMVLVRNIYKVKKAEKVIESELDSINIEKLIKDYFDEKLVSYRDYTGIVLVKHDEQTTWKILIQEPENALVWREIDDFEYTNFTTDIQKFIVKKTKINNIIGFMSVFKTGETVFKTKMLSGKWNNKGVYCNSLGKKDIIDRINMLLDEPVYSNEFIKNKSYEIIIKRGIEMEKPIENGIYKPGLCVILEILLRYYNEIEYKGKIWFFDNEKSILNGIINYKTE